MDPSQRLVSHADLPMQVHPMVQPRLQPGVHLPIAVHSQHPSQVPFQHQMMLPPHPQQLLTLKEAIKIIYKIHPNHHHHLIQQAIQQAPHLKHHHHYVEHPVQYTGTEGEHLNPREPKITHHTVHHKVPIVHHDLEKWKNMYHNMETRFNVLQEAHNRLQEEYAHLLAQPPKELKVPVYVDKPVYMEDTAKTEDMEKRCFMLMTELDRVNKVLEQRNNRFIQLENELNNRPQLSEKDLLSIKRTYQERESQLLFEMEQMRIRLSDAERNQIKIQYAAELTEKLQIMTGEMEKLNYILKSKIEENNDLKAQIQTIQSRGQQTQQSSSEITKLRTLLEMKTTELETIRERVSQTGEYQQKVMVVTLELERLNETLRLRSEETEKLRLKLKQSEDVQMQVFSLQNAVESQTLSIKQKMQQIANFQDEIGRINSLLMQRNESYGQLQVEFDKMSARYEEKCNECEEQRRLSGKLRLQVGEQRVHAETAGALQAEYDRQQQMLKNKENELVHYKSELHKTHIKNQELQSQVGQLREALKNMEQYKRKCEEMISERMALNERSGMMETLSSENRQLQIHIKELEATIQALEQERRRLTELSRVRSEEYETLKTQFQQLTLQHGKLSEQLIIIQELQQEIEQWKQRCQRIEAQYFDAQREAQQKQRQQAGELEQWKLKFGRLQSDLSNEASTELTKLRMECGSLRQRNQLLESQLMEKQSEVDKLEISFKRDLEFRLQQQQQDLTTRKTEDQTQLNTLRQQNLDMQAQLRQYELQFQAMKDEERWKQQASEDHNRGKFRDLEEMLASAQQQSTSYKLELESIREQLRVKERDLNKMGMQLQSVQQDTSALYPLQQRILKLTSENESLQTTISSLGVQIKTISSQQNQPSPYQSEIDRLKKEVANQKIEINKLEIRVQEAQFMPELIQQNRIVDTSNFNRQVGTFEKRTSNLDFKGEVQDQFPIYRYTIPNQTRSTRVEETSIPTTPSNLRVTRTDVRRY